MLRAAVQEGEQPLLPTKGREVEWCEAVAAQGALLPLPLAAVAVARMGWVAAEGAVLLPQLAAVAVAVAREGEAAALGAGLPLQLAAVAVVRERWAAEGVVLLPLLVVVAVAMEGWASAMGLVGQLAQPQEQRLAGRVLLLVPRGPAEESPLPAAPQQVVVQLTP